jgi:hypothetical protein
MRAFWLAQKADWVLVASFPSVMVLWMDSCMKVSFSILTKTDMLRLPLQNVRVQQQPDCMVIWPQPGARY